MEAAQRSGAKAGCHAPPRGPGAALPRISSGHMAQDAPSRIFRPGLLDGRVCVVSGAGTGLGRAIAIELATLGATVIGCGRRREPLDDTVSTIREADGIAEAEEMDIRDAEAVDGLFDRVVERHGRLDVLVNNAGG